MKRIEKLAPTLSEMYRSPDPRGIFCYSPGICALPSGRLVGTMDIFRFRTADPAIADQLFEPGSNSRGQIFLSDDGGKTWRFVSYFPFAFARPFLVGNSIYLLGHAGDLMIMRSDDDGETWSEAVNLTHGEIWHQSPCNVCYANGNVYLVMEKSMHHDCNTWIVSTLAPILMRASLQADLLDPDSWTYASPICFRDFIKKEAIQYIGIPFYDTLETDTLYVCREPVPRQCPPIGWLETNVVHYEDPDNIWYDETGHTFHLFMRMHSGGTGYAALLKVVEHEDGTMETMTEKVPSGKDVVFLPFPGGQMKFHIVYDEVTKLYWMLGTQATDSLIRPERMPRRRYDLPNNERQRMVLHFSKNCVDWCFAGLVDVVKEPWMSRHYAAMVISGNDLVILSRSGDHDAVSAHNGNQITFHRVENFRDLVY